ncbi:LysR substrate-binding domain-containing protein [Methyloligella sp. 2.7D]|uniref:LysR substrate-binding domain-containing protein n=1 Tax=unclassified Methyloligella TaxID=2625955 RepID=UPI00157C7B49|nr:LysR substrate-binding domain-containing protein [Methyloligella sp. GL2]QKP78658.1 LysR family transcriptional regulator [Methyloligella sp. GL2]
MTLEQLRIFVAVAEHEHVTRAAAELHLTQSAVSAAVAALEARHAVKLFDRVGRNIALTEAGRLFLVEARGVLARAAAAEQVLADLAGLKRGSLKLAASQTVASYWLPPLMQRYRAENPGISLSLSIGNTASVVAAVQDRSADIGFIEAEIDHPTLSAECVGKDQLVLAASKALAEQLGGAPLTAAQLKALPWVFREPGSGTRVLTEAALAEQGVDLADLDIVLELPSNEAVRAAIESGKAAAILSELVVAANLESGSLVPLAFPLPKRCFYRLGHKERSTTKAEAAFDALIAAARPLPCS